MQKQEDHWKFKAGLVYITSSIQPGLHKKVLSQKEKEGQYEGKEEREWKYKQMNLIIFTAFILNAFNLFLFILVCV